MGYIYMVTNKINGKKYIGQTLRDDIKIRWSYHKSMQKNSIGHYLYNAYKKYGIENFKFEIICICFDEDCNKYEIDYIKKYNTISPNGYNLKSGGENQKHHAETKKLMRQKNKKPISNETREKLKLYGLKCRGIKLSNEQKEKMSSARTKYWANISTEAFESISNKRKEIYLKKDSKTKQALENGTKLLRKKVLKFDKNGTLLNSYASISQAATENNLHISGISRACNHLHNAKESGGFIWEFG